jgi:ABC-2 type transport system ATP-binding protein
MEYLLEVKCVGKSYPGFNLKDISFALPRGYIMGLIGPNGAGKTTTIKLIMNLLRKNSGEILVFGLDHIKNEVEVKSRIGFVYDTPTFYEHLNLLQMKAIIAPFYKTWDDNKFQSLIRNFDLPPRKKIKTLSRGMKMKYALALALSHEAELIIMDEPTSGLDPVFRRELLDILHGLIENEQKSVLFSTHITSDLERVADFITFINRGELVFSASKEEILEKYGVIRAGKNKISMAGGLARHVRGYRESEFGIEILTNDLAASKDILIEGVVAERASLEDIVFLTGKGFKER